MRAKRRFDRFLVQREAKYFSKEGLGNWQECTINNVSRKGMKILFHERNNVGSTICLEIPVPGELVSISIYGILKWIEERGNDFIGGIELTKMLDDEKFSKLLISSRLSHKKISTNIIKEATEDMNAHAKETIPPLIPKQHFILSSFKKVFSLKSVSVSLLLLLSLLFLFLMERGSFSRSRFNEKKKKKDMVVQLKA
ncbi:MAG: PilZ domain-containing protein, partial [Deltaproteobacteria bacterium]|nr:PilZ domain-containing protein [Deltaproteobacteria bacterium]